MLHLSLSNYFLNEGDVLSGTSASGDHHTGILEGWFGSHWWTGRAFVLLATTLAVFAPLASFKRIGNLHFFDREKQTHDYFFYLLD